MKRLQDRWFLQGCFCSVIYFKHFLLMPIAQFHLWFQRKRTWKIFLPFSHYRLNWRLKFLGCGLCAASYCIRQFHDLVCLSEMIILKVLKKEPVWLLSLTQTALKVIQLSMDASLSSRCLRSPFPQPIKRVQTGKITESHNIQNWWLSWKLSEI